MPVKKHMPGKEPSKTRVSNMIKEEASEMIEKYLTVFKRFRKVPITVEFQKGLFCIEPHGFKIDKETFQRWTHNLQEWEMGR